MAAIKRRILLVENGSILCNLLRERMQESNTNIHHVDSFEEALSAFSRYGYSLVILVIQQIDGAALEIAYQMQAIKPIPILAITNIIESVQKVELFRVGVHAHIEMPVDIELCAAQANSLMNLYDAGVAYKYQDELAFGTELVIQPHFRRVFVHGHTLELTRKEFDLLFYLAQFPYQVFSYEQLYSHVWKDDLAIGGEGTVKVHIVSLRKKLRDIEKNCIQNVWGVGYRFIPPNGEQTVL